MRSAVLVMAKAPVPGQVKTRLGARVGNDTAAELAAAALLDTLDVCEQVVGPRGLRHLALAGDLSRAVRAEELRDRLSEWTVHPQVGRGFAERLVRAHADAGRAAAAPVVQIGMDTPHLTAAVLTAVSDRLASGAEAVLGPAEDGGWWVLGVRDPRFAEALTTVEMSTPRTYADTRTALERAGATVLETATLRDVDETEDADAASVAAPGTRFARLWAGTVR